MKRKIEDDSDTIEIKFAKLNVSNVSNANNVSQFNNIYQLNDEILYIIENGMASKNLINDMYKYYINFNNKIYKEELIQEFIEMYELYKIDKSDRFYKEKELNYYQDLKEYELELYKKIYNIHKNLEYN
jgi:hypothetical protein